MKIIVRYSKHILTISLLLFCFNLFAQWSQAKGPYGGTVKYLALKGDTVFAGAGGLHFSTNDGESWTKITNGLPPNVEINTIQIYGSTIFLGTKTGVYLSDDNGAVFKEVNNGLKIKNVVKFNIEGATILAGTIGGGMYRSTNLGELWTEVNDGLPFGEIASIALSGESIYVGMPFSGFYYSRDNCQSWMESNYDFRKEYIRKIYTKENTVYVGAMNGFFVSTDGGVNFKEDKNAGWGHNEVGDIAVLDSLIFIIRKNAEIMYTNINFPGKQWKKIGDEITGERINSITVKDNLIFVGLSISGILVSSDNGKNWIEMNNGLTSRNVIAIAANDSYIYAGTTEGVFVSSDNGENWTEVNTGLTNLKIQELSISGSTIYAGTSTGVFCSDNNGQMWRNLTEGWEDKEELAKGSPKKDVFSLAAKGSSIYIGTSHTVFTSMDAGKTWKNYISGMPKVANITSIIRVGKNLFAGTNSSNYGETSGVFLSENDGLNWKRLNKYDNDVYSLASIGNKIYLTDFYGLLLSEDNGANWKPVLSMTMPIVESINDQTIIVSNYGTPHVSRDAGQNWEPLSSTHSIKINSLVILGNKIFAGNVNGVFFSPDFGKSWKQINYGISNAIVYSLFHTKTSTLASTTAGMYISRNNGNSWDRINKDVAKDGAPELAGKIECFISKGNTIFAGTYLGMFKSIDGGNSWNECYSSYYHIKSFAVKGNTIFAGHGDYSSGGILFSKDDGLTWDILGDLKNIGLPSTAILSMAVKDSLIFAGTGDGLYGSSNGGKNWKQISIQAKEISNLVIVDGIIFAAEGSNSRGGIFKSADNGLTWTSSSNGLFNINKDFYRNKHYDYDYSSNKELRPITHLIVHDKILYASVEGDGIYKSADNGESWEKEPGSETDFGSLIFTDTNMLAGGNGIFIKPIK
jgi:photosystem II stability/assembly factor-like uncharacterized protein